MNSARRRSSWSSVASHAVAQPLRRLHDELVGGFVHRRVVDRFQERERLGDPVLQEVPAPGHIPIQERLGRSEIRHGLGEGLFHPGQQGRCLSESRHNSFRRIGEQALGGFARRSDDWSSVAAQGGHPRSGRETTEHGLADQELADGLRSDVRIPSSRDRASGSRRQQVRDLGVSRASVRKCSEQ